MKTPTQPRSPDSPVCPAIPPPTRLIRTWLVPLYLFGWELTQARRAAHLTKRELAGLMGLTAAGVDACERSLALPAPAELPRIAALADRLHAPALVPAFQANSAALARLHQPLLHDDPAASADAGSAPGV